MPIAQSLAAPRSFYSCTLAALALLALAGCQSASEDPHSIGGTISGLTVDGLVIAKGNETLTVSANSTQFTFNTRQPKGSAYLVTVQSEPSGLTCSVANGSGSIASADVSNVVVTCSTRSYSLGGTASGVTRSGLVLANANETLNVSVGATSFVFATPIASGAAYAVSVQSAPVGLICSVANGSSNMGTANANNVVVTCSQEAHSLGGTINGLTQPGLALIIGAEQLTVPSGATTFTLPSLVATTSSYEVTVATQPNGLACVVVGGVGTMGTADVTGIAVTCTNRDFTLGGTISGLNTSGLVLSNGAELLPVSTNATSFLFVTPVTFATNYAVTVATQPTGLTCSVSAGSGPMPAGNVNNVSVVCSTQSYTVGGAISGFTNGYLVLANGSDILTVSANATSFTLPTAAAYGANYSVTVATQPNNMMCSVSNGSGTMSASAVTDVSITCSITGYTLGGTISGLTAGGLVLANGTDRLSVAANAAIFSMSTGVAIGGAYNVTIGAQPAGMRCYVTDGSGTMGSSDVSNVQIGCYAREWAWVKGPNIAGVNGTYGTKGVGAAGNLPPPRNSAMTWTDRASVLWLFGGAGRVSGQAADLNDLWQYDSSLQEWTWIHGTNSPNDNGVYGTLGVSADSNEPPARHEGVTWVDANGKLWLFGGYSDAPGLSGTLNDLWRFDPLIREWTWMGGSNSPGAVSVNGTLGVAAPGNVPAARHGAVSWVDRTGRLWLFGGHVHPADTYLSDMWSYDPTTQMWTWERGPATANAAGVHGTRGVAAPGNVPGGRINAMGATISANQLLLFGGAGYDAIGTKGALNDLWSWDLTTHQWTWLSGSTITAAAGVYGTQRIPGANNTPGAHHSGLGWADKDGRFWTFGGEGANDLGVFDHMNDLWMYDINTQQWTWVSGSNSGGANGEYGILNNRAPTNSPGGRVVPSGWIDGNNRIFVFGGYGLDSTGVYYKLNDMWEF